MSTITVPYTVTKKIVYTTTTCPGKISMTQNFEPLTNSSSSHISNSTDWKYVICHPSDKNQNCHIYYCIDLWDCFIHSHHAPSEDIRDVLYPSNPFDPPFARNKFYLLDTNRDNLHDPTDHHHYCLHINTRNFHLNIGNSDHSATSNLCNIHKAFRNRRNDRSDSEAYSNKFTSVYWCCSGAKACRNCYRDRPGRFYDSRLIQILMFKSVRRSIYTVILLSVPTFHDILYDTTV